MTRKIPLEEKLQTRKIPLDEIISATNNFHKDNFIARGGFGNVYRGELSTLDGMHKTVAVKRLDHNFGQGNHEFLTEVTMLSYYQHENIVSFVGFSDERGEKILVYLYESKGSLDQLIYDISLKWRQRLQISIDVARGLNYLHHGVGTHHRILHRDIKSSNILLGDDWKAKVSDFGLSIIGPSNIDNTFVVTDPVGTKGYVDPAYYETDILTKESDVYSFGIVLFEILCGRLAYVSKFEIGRRYLNPLAKSHYEQNKLDEIINPHLRKQMQQQSLLTFSSIAYQCLNSTRSQRPTMGQVLGQLEEALQHQVSFRDPEDIETVYLNTNVSIHPTQYASKRINGRLELNLHGSSLFMTWIPCEGKSSNKMMLDRDEIVYTVKSFPCSDIKLIRHYTPSLNWPYNIKSIHPHTPTMNWPSDIKSIHHHTPTWGVPYILVVLLSGRVLLPFYFYSGGIRDFLATIEQYVLVTWSPKDPNVILLNKGEHRNPEKPKPIH